MGYTSLEVALWVFIFLSGSLQAATLYVNGQQLLLFAEFCRCAVLGQLDRSGALRAAAAAVSGDAEL
jgi:hypothetical protein